MKLSNNNILIAGGGRGIGLDALELSDCLTDAGLTSIQAAIAAYEAPMRERAAQEAKESLEMIEWMHGEDAQEKIVEFFKATANN